MIGIKAIKPYFTGEKVSIGNLPEALKLQGPELDYYNTCGIKTIYDSGDLSSYDLAKAASEQLLEEQGIAGNEIDFIIFIKSRIPEHFISSEATRLKSDLKADKAFTFSVSDLGCADSTLAIKLAKDLLTANRSANHVLIVYGSKLFTPDRFRYPVTITGDGAAACLIGRTEDNAIIDVQMESNGKYWDLFKIEYKDRVFDQYKEECSDIRKYGFELAIESKNRFRDINDKIIGENGLTKEDISHFMMQNISQRAYDYYEQAFEFKLSPFCKMNLTEYGHTGAADILLNYHAGINSGMFQKGAHVLIMNNSPVAAWSSMLIKV
jgi:3-oxoacyl-[acyl-carrier-protein] synthase III